MTTKQNITLAIIGSYCYIDNLVWNDNGSLVSNFTLSREMGIKQLGLNGGFTYFYDLGVQMGLDYVNANESILPGFHLNVKRFSDCGAYYPAVESFNGNSGGYAQAVTAIDVVGSKDVIGAVGIEYSTLAKGLAEILSNSKIPYCTPASGSPSFTDRNDYPYFFRTFLTLGLGEHMYQLLKFWNVKRIAVIYQKDDYLGSQFALDALNSMFRHSVAVVVKLPISTTIDEATFEYCKSQILLADARYLFVSGQVFWTNALYNGLGSRGFVGSKYVWIGINNLNSLATNPKGFIYLTTPLPNMNSFIVKQAAEMYASLSMLDSSILRFQDAIAQYGVGQAFDCVLLLALGFNKLLASNPTFTAEMLSNRSLQAYMNFTLFQNVGYDGISASPETLNQYGDLASPIEAFFTNDDATLTGFGITDMEATSFSYYPNMLPIFNDGSSTPPADGPAETIPRFIINTNNSVGIVLLFYVISMSIICVMSAIGFIYFRRKKTVTRTSLPSLLAFCGSMLVFTLSLIPLYSQPTGTSCKAMIWMQVLPFGVLMSSLIGKSWTDYKLIVVRRKNVSRLWVVRETVNLIVLAVEVGLLVLWSTLGSVSVAVVMTRTFIVEVCVLPGYSNPFGALLLAFNIILFCVASYLAFVTREAEVLVNESIFPSQICTTFGFLGMVVLPVLSVSEPGHNQIYIYGTAVWIAGLITMVAIVVPKAISIRADTKRINDEIRDLMKPKGGSNMFDRIKNATASFIENAEPSRRRQSVSLNGDTERDINSDSSKSKVIAKGQSRISSIGRSQRKSTNTTAASPLLKLKSTKEATQAQAYQLSDVLWYSPTPFPGKWHHSIASIWSCRRNYWIMFETPLKPTYVFHIQLEQLRHEIRIYKSKTVCVLYPSKGKSIWFDFESKSQADKFVSNFDSKLGEVKRRDSFQMGSIVEQEPAS